MPSFVSCKVEGLDELEDALLDLEPKKARAAMREAMDFAGTFMRVTMALLAPSASGFLARHIVSKITLSAKKDEAELSVGPSREAYYGVFDEFGSIHNKPPQPFIRPAFEQNKEKWLDVFSSKLRDALGL
jgi:HK97 gp10 family phage protein